MRFIAIFITLIIPPILSGTHPGTDRSSSKLGACAKRILGEVDGVHKQALKHEMEKEAQRVLWDFNYGRNLVLYNYPTLQDGRLHIYRGSQEMRPKGISNGLYYASWRNGKCVKLVAVMEANVVEVLLSSTIPRYQNRLSKFCKRGAAGTILRRFGKRELYNLISTDVAGAKGLDDRSAALTMGLIDIADVVSLSADGFACDDFWLGEAWRIPDLEIDYDLKPRVVLVYGHPLSLGMVPFKDCAYKEDMKQLLKNFGLTSLDTSHVFAMDKPVLFGGSQFVPIFFAPSDAADGVATGGSVNQLTFRESKNGACFILQGSFNWKDTSNVFATALIYDADRMSWFPTCGDWGDGIIINRTGKTFDNHMKIAAEFLKNLREYVPKAVVRYENEPVDSSVKAVIFSGIPISQNTRRFTFN